MSWIRLDDHFVQHPKVVRAGIEGAWLYLCGLSYCARYLTDGFIPKSALPTVSGLREVDRLSVLLVDLGLWHDRGEGFEVHDYLEYNPSKAQIEADKERDRSRKRNPDGIRAESGRNRSSPTPGKSSSNSKHQEIFGALIQSFGAADTTTSRQFYGKIARELIEVGATPEEVCKRAQVMFERDWKNPSPAALSKHWASLVASNGQPGDGKPGWDPTRASHARSSL